MQTEIELESGQSFVIAGLIDNQTSESLSKVPGIGDIPILGKLFQSKNVTRNNSELLVIVTPEIVRPIPAGQPVPELKFAKPFLPPNTERAAGPPRDGQDRAGSGEPAFQDYTDRATVAAAEAGAARRGAESRAEPARAGSRPGGSPGGFALGGSGRRRNGEMTGPAGGQTCIR